VSWVLLNLESCRAAVLLWKMIIYSCVSYRLLGWGCWSW
jgi:hypothetical protein